MTRVLLLGSGSSRDQRVKIYGRQDWTDDQIVETVDIERGHGTDWIHDLNDVPWPFPGVTYSEIHAYEILEHLGRQGDGLSFFQTFYECWRILVPGGLLAATVPHWRSMWAWGDPTHTRVINEGSLTFLSQAEYDKQVGVTPMSDLRRWWEGDFEVVSVHTLRDADMQPAQLQFVLRAIKPAREYPRRRS